MGQWSGGVAFMALDDFWEGRRVFLTGHSGFKGGWLALWLNALGARVAGFSLPPVTRPSLYEVARVAEHTVSQFADIRQPDVLGRAMEAFAPEVVFHLAAQPLVRESYRNPVETYATNVMGTVHLLEAVRGCPSVRAVVVVTTDKCYENQEWPWPYREQDSLGGHDPYSSSKACVELLCSAWRSSWLAEQGVALATARAGNVLGGGDWSAERLVPDILRAWQAGEPLVLRYPQATRPWQHVLDPLQGYLLLAQSLVEHGADFAGAWNFGPDASGIVNVQALVEQLAHYWPEPVRWSVDAAEQPHEAGLLALDSSKARQRLGWSPRWPMEKTLVRTLDWHLAWQRGQDMQQFSLEQIRAYQSTRP